MQSRFRHVSDVSTEFFLFPLCFLLHRGGQLPHPQIRANDFPYSVYLKYEFHLILSDLELFIYVLWTWLFSGGFVSVNAIEKKRKTPSRPTSFTILNLT